ncbi:Na+/H+ antiporter subunit D [Evansella cellulosilytica]|uniref:NADH/Ubiquinone/plastoquinone (Complex I) n=1 Tax=Evansella cellulosilytica (strain ATCC 21833 / DSM 2522 / FERM P-1141 / JCM 9156 / N-4) TaxID=649639 RepID=E6TW01_EVAC2|nr:Na+/H+ antiporter subunit D [Evansella cellulosilytica]ADU29824.1 NADH/Ubiquinone/plastoquinone (complex I) [Evansella cellulosilytica DSM 2522]
MNNLVLLPVLIPFIVGVILILLRKNIPLQRFISGVISLGLIGLSIYLTYVIYQDGIIAVELGNWQAPFGIVLVGDLFSSIMLVLASIVAAACLFFAFQTLHQDREKYYFYPFYFFLLTGVNGSFLTGDIFNLFVFFEVMLISSFVLIVMGGKKYQLRESFKYVVISTFGSIFFIIAIALLYSVTGTLNFAHLAERVAEVEQTGVLTVVAILFLIVFGLKGALVPLHFWLPNAYFGPPTAVAALLGGLLTKVGVYSIMRTYTLIFTHNQDFTLNVVLVLAGLTMFFGVLGAVSKFDFKRILAIHIVSQVGYMIMGLGIFTTMAIAGSIYIIAHNMIVKTALFLFCGATEKVTGTTNLKKMSGVLKTHPHLGWLFFIAAISLAGIPPLSGFFSKFALVLSGLEEGRYIIVAVSLIVGLLTLFSMVKIFMYVFWGSPSLTPEEAKKRKVGKLLLPGIPLVMISFLMGVLAEPLFQLLFATADQMLDPSIYINSVLKE